MNDVGRNKELSRRWFEEVWNRRRVGAIDELFAADGVAHGLGEFGREPLPGPAHFKMFWEKFCGAFPDLRITVEEVIGEGDFTSVRFSCRGTHQGDHLGPTATQKPVRATGITMIRWRNGQIAEAWNEFDAIGLFKQIGAI